STVRGNGESGSRRGLLRNKMSWFDQDTSGEGSAEGKVAAFSIGLPLPHGFLPPERSDVDSRHGERCYSCSDAPTGCEPARNFSRKIRQICRQKTGRTSAIIPAVRAAFARRQTCQLGAQRGVQGAKRDLSLGSGKGLPVDFVNSTSWDSTLRQSWVS